VKAVFDELKNSTPRRHFTIGIIDDVTHTSLAWDPSFRTEGDDVSTSLFYGLGADGTVGANKNSIKIIGHETDRFVQGYFVYDSKKSGAITVSHLRTSPRPIRSAYLLDRAGFVACHQFEFVDKIDVLEYAAPGAVFLLNASGDAATVWDRLPREMQQQMIEKRIRFFVIDAYALAKQTGMGGRINTIMQTCFFGISGILPREEAIAHIKKSIEKTYGKRGPEVVRRNCEVVDQALAQLHEVLTAGINCVYVDFQDIREYADAVTQARQAAVEQDLGLEAGRGEQAVQPGRVEQRVLAQRQPLLQWWALIVEGDARALRDARRQQLLAHAAGGHLRLGIGHAAVGHHYEVAVPEQRRGTTDHGRDGRFVVQVGQWHVIPSAGWTSRRDDRSG